MERATGFLPFVSTLRGYTSRLLRADLAAGLTVAAVALPQSMAYAVIAGVHPKFGLYAATFPVMAAALFGSSKYLIAGPTNAISMLVQASLAALVVGGTQAAQLPEPQLMAVVLAMSVLAGLIQLGMGLARLGALVTYISHSVVLGFTAGAGILIIFNQLKNLLGLAIPKSPFFLGMVLDTVKGLPGTNGASLAVGLFSVAVAVAARLVSRRLPAPFLAIALSAVLAWSLDLGAKGVRLVGDIPRSLPPLSLPVLDPALWETLFMPALAVAILGLVEALAIAKALADTDGERVDGNQEFIGQGVANIVAGFFSGLPGSGSFTRSAVNCAAGAATRFSGVFAGLLTLAVVLAAAPLAGLIPIPALAGILMVIAWNMIDGHGIRVSLLATRADRWALLATFAATLTLELENAVFVGVFLSIGMFLRKVSHPMLSQVVPAGPAHRFLTVVPGRPVCPQITVFRLEGPLFFGAINELEERLFSPDRGLRGQTIILEIKHVHFVDATVAHGLKTFLAKCRRERTRFILSDPRQDSVLRTFLVTGVLAELEPDHLTSSKREAIGLAFGHYVDPEICRTCASRVFRECASMPGPGGNWPAEAAGPDAE